MADGHSGLRRTMLVALKNSPVELHLKERCETFFEFRVAARNADELQEFMFWLGAKNLRLRCLRERREHAHNPKRESLRAIA